MFIAPDSRNCLNMIRPPQASPVASLTFPTSFFILAKPITSSGLVGSSTKNKLNLKLEASTDSITKLDIAVLNKESTNEARQELGPLIYLSELTGKPMNIIVNWLLLLIVFVFDPLAVSLVVAYQVALTGGIRRYEVYNEKKVVEKKPIPVNKTTWKKEKVQELKPTPVEEPEIVHKVRRGGIGRGKT